MPMIRAVEYFDIPQLVDLHVRCEDDDYFSREQIAAAYSNHFASMFLDHPWAKCGLSSLVAETSSGRIVGFIGIVPRPMSFAGRQNTAAVSTQLTVDPEFRSKLLGVQLLKQVLQGPQDVTIADYANAATRRIWETLGGSTAQLYGLTWSRLLNPGRSLIHSLSTRQVCRPFIPLLRPFARLFDHVTSNVTRLPWSMPRVDSGSPSLTSEELTADTYSRLLPELTRQRKMSLVVDHPAAVWLFDRLDRMWTGRAMYRILLRDSQQAPAGWFIYSIEPDGSAEVAQIVARRHFQTEVIDCLIRHSHSSGARKIGGRVQPELLDEYSGLRCHLHTATDFALVYARDTTILRTFETGTAFLSLLEGEGCLYLPISNTPAQMPVNASVLTVTTQTGAATDSLVQANSQQKSTPREGTPTQQEFVTVGAS